MADNIYGGTSIQVYPEPGVAPLTTPHRDVEAFLGYVSRFNSINFHAKDDDVREWRFNKQYDNWQDTYGADAVYTRMALESLEDWQRLSAGAGLPIFHPIGILFFFPHVQPFLEDELVHPVLGVLAVPIEVGAEPTDDDVVGAVGGY